MPKRDIEDFISHWSGAELSENQISQPFLVDLCNLLEEPQPDNKRNGNYTFEFHVSEPRHGGTAKHPLTSPSLSAGSAPGDIP